MMILAMACAAPSGPVVTGFALSTPADTPLSRRLTLRADRPVQLQVTLQTATHTHTVQFRERAAAFDVPLLGFAPDTITTVSITLTDPTDRTALTLEGLTVVTDPLPPSFPVIDALAVDPDRAEPGYWLVSLGVPDGPFWLALLDASDLSVAWLYTGPIDWGDVRMTERGTLLGLWGGVHEMDLLGNTLRRWGNPDVSRDPAIDVAIPWPRLHHEVFPLADGSMLSLVGARARAEAYPRSYDPPIPMGPADIADDHVVWFDEQGGVLATFPLSAHLDTSRVGFGSLNLTGAAFDWTHTNAVIDDPSGGFVVSSRHQDALVKFTDEGEVGWILGDPAGWGEAFAPLLLSPDGGTSWPYHQHGPNIGPDGRIVVFDNRMVTHTPYTPEPAEVPASRVVAYDVDPAAMTVREAWSWAPPDGPLLSNALGNAVWLPQTGHVLASWGFLDGEGDLDNASAGRGRKHVRLMEIDPADPAPVVDARLWIDPAIAPEGVKAYRVTHVPSLYGPLVE